MAKNTDPSDIACIEILRPKTVPDQLVALGIVSHASDIQVRLQITGGIVCLVDQFNISKSYTKRLEQYQADYRIGKQPLIEPPKLNELFKKGEQYVCKIIDRQTRKGYAEAQDIIATVDPEQIQEGNIPTYVLAIPHVPLQGAIISVEDHGYRVDLGFKNITGFLKFDKCREQDDERFQVGQVIRCCSSETLSFDNDSRIVQLSMTKEDLKASCYSAEKCCNHALTPKTILPGSMGYLTVMKTQKGGLIVNFLDEYAGFVCSSHLENEWQSPEKDYKISDNRNCTVLYYNPDTKTFALSLRPQRKFEKSVKEFMEAYHVGQIIKEAKVAYLIGSKAVYFKVDKHKALANVRDSLNEDVSTMNKDELHLALDSAYADGSIHKARIKSINYADLMLVLNLRQEFLEQSCVSVDELEPADFLEAQVKKHVSIGIVVSFGLNLRAIILNSHLKDFVSAKSHKKYPIGMPLKCRVLKIDPDKYPTRVYLTNKEQLMEAEMTIIDAYDKSFKGETINAIVAKLKTNGIIVELFNNVKGFIPQRFCSDSQVRAVSDLFEVGQVVTCTVYRVDSEAQTLSLSIVSYEKVMELLREKKRGKQERNRLKELNKIDRKIEQNEIAAKAKAAKSKKRKFEEAKDEVGGGSKRKELKRSNAENCDGGSRNKHQVAINAKRMAASVGQESESEEEEDDDDDDDEGGKEEHESGDESSEQEEEEDATSEAAKSDLAAGARKQKSRLERSKEAKLREEKIREVERKLLDPNRPAQSIADFERLVLKTPNSADAWIKYSRFFLDNVETEKARIVCRRALATINFRMEKEKLRIWLHMISIEAKFGGSERLRELMDEAAQTNDKLEFYRRASKVLVACGELDEAEQVYEQLLDRLGGKRLPEIWIDYVVLLMEQRKDLERARKVYERAVGILNQLGQQPSDVLHFRSRFAHLEFKYGDVERGKTMFESLLSEHPKRKDLWSVYEAAVRKFGTRQLNTDEVRQHNEQLLQRIASLQE